MAIELGSNNSTTGGKLWTMYQADGGLWLDQNHQDSRMLPYTRLCADAPFNVPRPLALTFWVNPLDELTQAAGFGSGWLQKKQTSQRMGLVLVKLNTLMLDAQTTDALNLNQYSASDFGFSGGSAFEQRATTNYTAPGDCASAIDSR